MSRLLSEKLISFLTGASGLSALLEIAEGADTDYVRVSPLFFFSMLFCGFLSAAMLLVRSSLLVLWFDSLASTGADYFLSPAGFN